MKICALMRFNDPDGSVEAHPLWKEVKAVIEVTDALNCRTKVSEELNMAGRLLYSPSAMNTALRDQFESRGWASCRLAVEHSMDYYVGGYSRPSLPNGFREIDFVKGDIGIEVQFGKYAFMAYDILAKMPIFQMSGIIEMGIEIVPMKSLAEEMSSGVSYFEQIAWDLEARGESDVDIPVLVVGVDA